MNAAQQQSQEIKTMPVFSPSRLLDELIAKLKLKNDAALAHALEVAPPVLSKIRHGRLPVGASLLIRMYEASGLSIRDLRAIMGDRRERYRVSTNHPTQYQLAQRMRAAA